jgi:uncharacterized membrane protein YebE (DUF533 family)
MSEPMTVAPEDGAAAASGEPIQSGLPEYHQSIVEVIASKILVDWLRNRQQLLAPYTLDFAKLDAPDIEIVVHAMMAAAAADGTLDGRERSRVETALRRLNRDESQWAKLAPMLDQPRALPDVLLQVRDPQTAALVYAASLAAIDQRERVNRYYLRYLAARLHLPRDLVKTIEQRFRASGWSA